MRPIPASTPPSSRTRTSEIIHGGLAERWADRPVKEITAHDIFDDHGNRMTPSHSNRDGVRYRYYVSHVLLQRREKDAGHVTRVPALSWRNSLPRRSAPTPSRIRDQRTIFPIAR